MKKSDAGALKALDYSGLGGIRKSSLPHESERRVAGFGTGFNDKLSDVAGTADDQNFALFRHLLLNKIRERFREITIYL